ncbi:MAG: membrane-associated phospholipid phosphatase [Psychromonas sp.]|jgi:membrane-associated phospholipid phosphatase|uniref:phosphatase PAP2 family protein n=1 Tax=Psychromonas sp. TaxID=1884585 RepID=UPI0039E4F533
MTTFKSAMDSQATLKERFVWLVYMGVVFFLLYGAANEFASINAPHLSIFFDWEKHIAFLPPFIVPYMSSDLVFVVAFLLAQTRLEIRVLALRVLFIVVFSVLIFVLFPLQFSFDKPAIESFTFLFKLLEADKPFNQLPSLHVSFSIVFWFSMKDHMPNRLLKIALGCWLMLIVLSTLFVFQHHFIDIPSGFLVGMLAVYLFREGRNEQLLNKFMTPRHLKMGLYFLALSTVLMILSFTVSALFIYFFLSVFSVSIVYAFGLNNLLVTADGKVSYLQWLLFGPYFLGSKISWMFYKRSLPLLAKVDDGVYIGRHPSINEYTQIRTLGIKQVINLAMELQLNKTDLIQHRLNFLDQTIQNPVALHQAVLLIESNKSDGIYVHCALGLSRSVLVVWAWMIFNGKTEKEIKARLEEIRPRYVQSKYMQVNIDLYTDFLQNY